MDNEKLLKNAKQFSCEKCDYICCNKTNYNKHLSTRKHLMDNKDKTKLLKVALTYKCDNCSNIYKHQSGLCKHKT